MLAEFGNTMHNIHYIRHHEGHLGEILRPGKVLEFVG